MSALTTVCYLLVCGRLRGASCVITHPGQLRNSSDYSGIVLFFIFSRIVVPTECRVDRVLGFEWGLDVSTWKSNTARRPFRMKNTRFCICMKQSVSEIWRVIRGGMNIYTLLSSSRFVVPRSEIIIYMFSINKSYSWN